MQTGILKTECAVGVCFVLLFDPLLFFFLMFHQTTELLWRLALAKLAIYWRKNPTFSSKNMVKQPQKKYSYFLVTDPAACSESKGNSVTWRWEMGMPEQYYFLSLSHLEIFNTLSWTYGQHKHLGLTWVFSSHTLKCCSVTEVCWGHWCDLVWPLVFKCWKQSKLWKHQGTSGNHFPWRAKPKQSAG